MDFAISSHDSWSSQRLKGVKTPFLFEKIKNK